MDSIRFFIMWGPTFLFIVMLLLGILIGVLRGFRKSTILFIHMLVASLICLIVYLCFINNPNLDSNMVNFVNGIMNKYGDNYLQRLLEVNPDCTTLHQMLMEKLISGLDSQDLIYYLVADNGAYLNTLVDMSYHLVLAVICSILYFGLIFVFYLIYLFAYPVRRKIKKENKKFQQGLVKTQYKRRRVLGGVIGGIRSVITGIVCFSFLGALLFVITGGSDLPGRDDLKENQEIEFTDTTFNQMYDYYSYVCEMNNTGIFKVLNSIKDTNNTPIYFYFADLVLQGRLTDENIEIENEKIYFRDEVGSYVNFLKKAFVLVLKNAEPEDLDFLISDDEQMTDKTNVLIKIMEDESFASDFTALIDEFEGTPFVTHLCLSSLTSLVNHIDVATDNEDLIGLVNQLFKGEDAIKVSDLATESDIKNIFKGLVYAVSTSDLLEGIDEEGVSEQAIATRQTKKTILLTQKILPYIQGLSLFQERADIGNKIIKGLYSYCSTHMVSDELELPEVPATINWINEFNVLLDACDPLLTIAYAVYDSDSNELISKFTKIFEGEEASAMEKAYDSLTLHLSKSNLLDVVFKSSIVGEKIDQIVIDMIQDPEAQIPKNIDYVGKDGECSILLSSVKLLLKNGGGEVILNMMESESELSSEDIIGIFEILTKEIPDGEGSVILLNKLLESKLLYYTISTYITYAEFGSFKIYLPKESVNEIVEGEGEGKKVFYIIKHEELEVISNLVINCSDLIVNLIEDPENINYAELLTNEYINETLDTSPILQGTIANVVINVSKDEEEIILPVGYDDPELWLSRESEDGEVQKLVHAIRELADVKIEDEYLINLLLNGEIKAKNFLELENSTLQKLCTSKVLQYTISDMATRLGSTEKEFEIVVAYASLETVNAETTTSKTVNVIQSAELADIFIEIKTIIDFDENDEIKILYNEIFKNKAEISKNKTLTATIIQNLFNNNEEGFMVVPEDYQTDFEKLKSQADLTGNVWFGTNSDVLDDELYMMLAAVETFIDKDEDGNIPNEFDFDNLQNELKLRQNEIDTICASAILNASLSEKIVNIFDVPLDKYIDQNIEKVELNAFFEALFKMFDKTEIIVKELDENLFDLNFERNAIPVILDSVIMQSTISEKITNLHDLAIPETDVQEISFVNKPDGYLIHKTELETVFEAMFVMLQTDKIMVNDLNVEVTSFSITKEAVSLMTSSSILRTTVSEKLASNPDLVILKNDTLEQPILHRSNSVHTIDEAELDKLLNSMFTILNVQEFTVNDVTNEFSDLSIKKKDIPILIDSNILNATLSLKVTSVEDLVIPLSIVDSSETVLGTTEYVLISLEARQLLESIFVIAGTEEIAVNDFSSLMNTYDLNSKKIDTLLESIILQATLSKNFMEGTNLVIPSVVLESISILNGADTSQIIKEELEIFFDAIFTTTDNSISGTDFDLEQMNLPTTYKTASTMTNSLIISATLSSNVMAEDSIVKVVEEALTPYEFNQAFTVEKYINQEELIYLLLALTNGMGKTNPTQLSFDDIAIPTEMSARQALVDSLIIRTTISEKVLNQDAVQLSLNNPSLDTTKHMNQASVGILSSEEINRIIVGLELLSPGNSSFDNLTLDIGQIINLENSGEVLEAIAQSEVYRSIISDTLGQQSNFAGTPTFVYQLFCSSSASHQVKVEGTYEMYFYDLHTIEIFGVPNSGYVIQYPNTTERVYINFYLEEEDAIICSKADIKALEFTSKRSF